jgi:2-dehydropantoate 2-reductase
MRFVIFGAGAIGGVIGARLHQAGREVVLIARGAHHDAIASHGLRFETPQESVTLAIQVVRAPSAIDFAPDDVVLLSTKTQDSQTALDALRDAAPPATPIVCMQNGVENERIALRRFPDVYGGLVMCPTAHLQPGLVQAYGARLTGQLDIGRYPSGTDQLCDAVCAALSAARFSSSPRTDIMCHKRAKLINNLGNSINLICGDDDDAEQLSQLVETEGREVLRAAGIEFESDEVRDVGERWAQWGVGEIDGTPRAGGSTWQSVARGAGSVETDYLNGEIVLVGRQIGVQTPVNELLQQLARETIRERHSPGWMPAADVLARL